MNHKVKKIVYPIYSIFNEMSFVKDLKIKKFVTNGKKPWSLGYKEFKRQHINDAISNSTLLSDITNSKLPKGFGKNIDERIIEYAWIFSKISKGKSKFLDAGSTFNFKYVLDNPTVKQKDLTIYTFYPEIPSFPERSYCNYVYGDLRDLPFENESFEEIVSQSTIEHIDMDNELYGYDIKNSAKEPKKSYSYLKALEEMLRVLKSKGNLYVTFPYGKYENHGFFQQFDEEMVDKIIALFSKDGEVKDEYAKYTADGWVFTNKKDCENIVPYNPHTGKGKGDDGAAHCRSVCLISFTKS